MIAADGLEGRIVAAGGNQPIGQGVDIKGGNPNLDGFDQFPLDPAEPGATFEHEFLFLGIH